MSYATPQDFINRFGEQDAIGLTDRTGAGVVDTAVLTAALDEADAEITPYLAPRYAIPLATVPRILVGYVCDIARYRLTGGSASETDAVRNRYKDAVAFLDKVSRGQISLGLDAAGGKAQPANTVRFSTPNGRVFGRGVRG